MVDKIKKWYRQGLWSAQMVDHAVRKGALTAGEGEAILEEAEHEDQ